MARKLKTKADIPAQSLYVPALSKKTIDRGTERLKEIGETKDPVLRSEAIYWKAAIEHENAILAERKAWGDDPHRTREKPANPKGWNHAMVTLDKTLKNCLSAYGGWLGYLKRQNNPSMEIVELVQPIIADNLDALGMFNLQVKDKKFYSHTIAKAVAEVIAKERISVTDADMGIPPLCEDCDS